MVREINLICLWNKVIGFPPDNFNFIFFFLNALKRTLHTKNYCFRHWKMWLFNRKNMQQETNWKLAGTLQYFPSMFWHAGTLKKLFFPSLVAFKQPLFFFWCCLMWGWSLSASQADIYSMRKCSDMKVHQKTTCIEDDCCCCCFQHYWSRNLVFFFFHQDKERIAYEQKIFLIEKKSTFSRALSLLRTESSFHQLTWKKNV